MDNLVKLNSYNRYWMVANRVLMALSMTAMLAYLPMIFIGPILFEIPSWVFTIFLVTGGIISISNLHAYTLGYMLQVTLTRLTEIKKTTSDQNVVDKIDDILESFTEDY